MKTSDGTESGDGLTGPHIGPHPLPAGQPLEAENLAEADELRHEEALRESMLRVPK